MADKPLILPLMVALANSTSEIKHPEYQRQESLFQQIHKTTFVNVETVTFPKATEAWGTATHALILTTAGDHLAALPFSPPLELSTGDYVELGQHKLLFSVLTG